MYSIVLDNRERILIDLFKHNNVECVIEQLDLGDIIIRKDDKDILIFERKTIPDLKASICDGRAREQKLRLTQSGFELHQVSYIIEGFLSIDPTSNTTGVTSKTLISSMINTMFRDNLKIHRTKNINETFNFVTRLYDKLVDNTLVLYDKETTSSNSSIYKCLKKRKKDNITTDVFFVNTLCILPNVTEQMALSIHAIYPSIRALIMAYETLEDSNERETLLKNITYNTCSNKNRKIGPVCSKKIYIFLFNI